MAGSESNKNNHNVLHILLYVLHPDVQRNDDISEYVMCTLTMVVRRIYITLAKGFSLIIPLRF